MAVSKKPSVGTRPSGRAGSNLANRKPYNNIMAIQLRIGGLQVRPDPRYEKRAGGGGGAFIPHPLPSAYVMASRPRRVYRAMISRKVGNPIISIQCN